MHVSFVKVTFTNTAIVSLNIQSIAFFFAQRQSIAFKFTFDN